jgi:primosomal protein N' (replication factor Y)
MHCTVITASRSRGIGGGLTYETTDASVKPGSRVLVPLRNALVEGIVLAVTEKRAQEDFDVKMVKEVLSNQPLLTEAQIKTLLWVAEYYHCTVRHALSVFLPAPPWNTLAEHPETFYKVQEVETATRGTKQKLVTEFLAGKEWVMEDELRAATGASRATLKALEEKGVVAREERMHTPLSPHSPASLQSPTLTTDQESAYQSIKKNSHPSLLFGVTGSGKTEVYAALIADALREGKGAILLVPEILLTEHIIGRFEELLGGREKIAILHSRLTNAERRSEWRRVRRGDARLVIGSRSALFAPVDKLGVIIMDEEHEWTYKNEQTPRYHARETAEVLARNADAKFLMGTATPSLESWSRTKSGTYHLARLPKRYKDAALPTVRVIDLADAAFGKQYPFTEPLIDAIRERLARGEQSVLFLNRRGVASALLCLQCRRRVVSASSQKPFTVHRSGQGRAFLLDHTSGERSDMPALCPHCSSARLHAVGAGTQKIEDLLTQIFPNARLLRADSDTLTHPEHMRLLLKKMREGSADILLGTQSVVKGLDLPEVTLAAVLVADVGLSLPHFRAGERIFQLLTQLTGRSGRTKPGEVIIQTFRPGAPEIEFASRHETEAYLEQELKLRLYSSYPPATRMLRLVTKKGAAKAEELRRACEETSQKKDLRLVVSAAPTLFGGGSTWHVLVRGANPTAVIPSLDLEGVTLDVDPLDCV